MTSIIVIVNELFTVVPGVPYNVSIAAANDAGIGELISFVYFTQELGMRCSASFAGFVKYSHVFYWKNTMIWQLKVK